jgi:hypothetical protein
MRTIEDIFGLKHLGESGSATPIGGRRKVTAQIQR